MRILVRRVCVFVAMVTVGVSITTCDIGMALEEILITANSVTLAWDPPEETEDSIPVASYRVYFNSHESSEDWVLLAEVDATDEPEYTVIYADLVLEATVADLVFAVTSVGANSLESEYHTSADATAIPPSGWYVHWEAAE